MKKFLKVVSITGAAFLLIGIITICVAIFLFKLNPSTSGDDDLGDLKFSYGNTDINDVRITSTYGDIEVQEGDEWTVEFTDTFIPKSTVLLDGSSLSINAKSPCDITLLGWDIGFFADYNIFKRSKIILTYPAGTELGLLFCNSGIGSIKADGLRSDMILCQMPAGKLDLNNCKSSKIAFDSVIGYIETNNVNFDRLDLDIRTGIADIDKTSAPASGINYNSKLIYEIE